MEQPSDTNGSALNMEATRVPFDERDNGMSTVASYGLLASFALTVIHRIKYLDSGKAVRQVDDQDVAYLVLLQELLAGSARGAQLSGHHGLQDLMGGSENLSLDAKLQMYHVVDQMVGDDRYEGFVTAATEALDKLRDSRTRSELTRDQRTFVDGELTDFLERLKRAGDFVAVDHEPFSLHRALA